MHDAVHYSISLAFSRILDNTQNDTVFAHFDTNARFDTVFVRFDTKKEKPEGFSFLVS